jgi:hypothetical protein
MSDTKTILDFVTELLEKTLDKKDTIDERIKNQQGVALEEAIFFTRKDGREPSRDLIAACAELATSRNLLEWVVMPILESLEKLKKHLEEQGE